MDVEKIERQEVEVDDDGRVRTGATHNPLLPEQMLRRAL
jgi:hypothetical protein